MLSSKLIQMIEDHADQITASVVRQIRQDARLLELGRLPESELRGRAHEILKHLGRWLLSRADEVAERYERLGRTRFEEGVPLHEIVHALHLIKEKMVDFVREQGVAQTTVQIYAEEELEYCVDRFFDHAVYHVVRGYEEALCEEARPAGAALKVAR